MAFIELGNDTFASRSDLEKMYGKWSVDRSMPHGTSGLTVYSERNPVWLPQDDVVSVSFTDSEGRIVEQHKFAATKKVHEPPNIQYGTSEVNKLGGWKRYERTRLQHYRTPYTHPITGEDMGEVDRMVVKHWSIGDKNKRKLRPSAMRMVIGEVETNNTGGFTPYEIRHYIPYVYDDGSVGIPKGKQKNWIEHTRIFYLDGEQKPLVYQAEAEDSSTRTATTAEYFIVRSEKGKISLVLSRQAGDGRSQIEMRSRSGLSVVRDIPQNIGAPTTLSFGK